MIIERFSKQQELSWSSKQLSFYQEVWRNFMGICCS